MTDKTVLVSDDHPLFRRGVREAIEEIPGYHVVAEAGDGETALQHLEFFRPDFAIVDLAMPRLDGFQVVERAAEAGIDTRIIVMTVFKQMAYLHRAVDLGASGFLVKDDAQDELVRCLETAAAGDFYLSPAIGTPAPPDPLPADPEVDDERIGLLTPQQREVLRHLAQYKTSKEIARLLDLSPRTVENHRFNITTILDLQGPNRLLRFAVRHQHLL
jgi:DNA-binding NarL/FixJ family response regulator